jgi:hypothetical protein
LGSFGATQFELISIGHASSFHTLPTASDGYVRRICSPIAETYRTMAPEGSNRKFNCAVKCDLAARCGRIESGSAAGLDIDVDPFSQNKNIEGAVLYNREHRIE